MTDLSPERVAEIAEGLNVDQREVVLALSYNPSRLGQDHNWRRRLRAVETAPAGIFQRRYMTDARRYWLTAFGLAIRDHLLKSGGSNG